MITSLCLNKEGTHALINTGAQVVKLIDLRTHSLVRDYTGHSQGRFSIRSTFAGAHEHLIVSGSEDGKVFVWQREQGVVLQTMDRHFGPCNDVAWHPTKTMLATCGDDGAVIVFVSSPSKSASRGDKRTAMNTSTKAITATATSTRTRTAMGNNANGNNLSFQQQSVPFNNNGVNETEGEEDEDEDEEDDPR
eukprot:m.155675 g.155675  ORF g.155675 m.155675 type:complete len:192 (-) comp13327_c1_seq1:287-862(-)